MSRCAGVSVYPGRVTEQVLSARRLTLPDPDPRGFPLALELFTYPRRHRDVHASRRTST